MKSITKTSAIGRKPCLLPCYHWSWTLLLIVLSILIICFKNEKSLLFLARWHYIQRSILTHVKKHL